MIQEPNENFDLEGHNFQLASEGVNSETMENKDPAINQHEVDNSDAVYESDKELDNYSGNENEYDPYQDDLDDEDIDENVDEDLDDDGDDLDDDEDDFDENDKSDY
jgi:hypothetical protein